MKMKNIKKALSFIILGLAGAALASCGTVHGIGHDVERVGDGIQDAAR